MAQLFGKNYQETGKSSSPLLLRSNGEIKLQWGNKFIDLIKNGKINSESKDVITSIDSSGNITSNGIYLVTSDNSVWFYLDGVKLELSNSENTYVSFLIKQEATAEQKYQALTNIGFYYSTLEEAQQAGLVQGIIYIEADNSLYYVKEGNLIKYTTNALKTDSNNSFKEIFISDIHIYNNGDMYLDVDNSQYIKFTRSSITLLKQLIPSKDIYSSNYSYNQGYALYNSENKSILEVDSINWRNIDKELPTMESIIDEKIGYNKPNVIKNCEYYSENNKAVKGYLKYTNEFKVNDYVYIALNISYYTYIITITTDENNDVNININQTVPEGYILTVQSSLGKYSFTGEDTTIKGFQGTYQSATMYYNGIKQEQFKLVFGENSNPKKQLMEFQIISINQEDNSIIFSVENNSLQSSIVEDCYNSRITLSRTNSLYLENNYISLIERKEEKNELTDETTASDIIHTKIGEVSEKEFDSQLNPKQDDSNQDAHQERPSVGIYSDNLIGLNPTLYNGVFKGDYPKYTGKVPEKLLDQANNQNLVNLEWFKQLYNQLVPIGTIIMFNSTQNIPDGWCVCDGTNGTPNLIGKFIKAGTNLDDNETDLDTNNQLTINVSNLPNHTHSSSSSKQEFLTSAYLTKGSSGISGTFYSATEGTEIKVQTSSENVSRSDSKTTFDNKPIKVEPHAYSLIFIMKYKDLD